MHVQSQYKFKQKGFGGKENPKSKIMHMISEPIHKGVTAGETDELATLSQILLML